MIIDKYEMLRQLKEEGFPVELTDNVLMLQPGGDVEAFERRIYEAGYESSYGYAGKVADAEFEEKADVTVEC